MKLIFVLFLVFVNFLFPLKAEAKQPAEESPPSIPMLMEKEFDGRGFSVKKILAGKKDYTRYLITYKSGDLTISGIMNLPKGRGPFPVLILNHGFIHPKYYTVGRGLKREQDYFARKGYIVIHPDYRNHGFSDKDPQSESNFRLGYVEDVINLVLAVRKSNKKYFDKQNIGMLGHSLGGGICLNIMVTKPDLVKAHVLYAPVSADYYDNFMRWIQKGRPEIAQKIIRRHGTPETDPEFWAELSAINYLDNIKTPIMLHHGTADDSVPVEWSDKLAKALEEKGKSVVFYRYPGGKHEFIKYWPAVMKRTVGFFDKYLKNVMNARAGENFTISLESNPTTGYSWQLAKPLDEKIVQLVGSEYVPSKTDLVGAGGEEKWTFLAVKKGSTRVALEYVRSWEEDDPAVEEKTFLIRVD